MELDQEYLTFTWENRKFWLENQMVGGILCGKLRKTIMACDQWFEAMQFFHSF